MTEMDQALGPDSNASFPSLQLVEIELNSDPAGFPLLRALTLPSSSSGLHSTPVNNRKKKKVQPVVFFYLMLLLHLLPVGGKTHTSESLDAPPFMTFYFY